MNGELPELFEINQRTARNIVSRAPKIDGLFRPEEEHGRSRENEIVPPMRRRNGKMRDVRFQNRRTVFYFKRQRFAGVSILCATGRITIQLDCDSVRIPNAVRV